MQQVTSHVPFFQNPIAMFGVSVVFAIVSIIFVLSTKGKKYNRISKLFLGIFVVIAVLMVVWIALFAFYN